MAEHDPRDAVDGASHRMTSAGRSRSRTRPLPVPAAELPPMDNPAVRAARDPSSPSAAAAVSPPLLSPAAGSREEPPSRPCTCSACASSPPPPPAAAGWRGVEDSEPMLARSVGPNVAAGAVSRPGRIGDGGTPLAALPVSSATEVPADTSGIPARSLSRLDPPGAGL